MNRILFLLFVIFTNVLVVAKPFDNKSHDWIVLRDGNIIEAKVQGLSTKVVDFQNLTNKVKSDQLPLSDIYMIKYAKRGNVYIMPDCRRRSGENQELGDSETSIIFTSDYRELVVYNLEIDVDRVYYTRQKATKKNKNPRKFDLQTQDIFMIVYSDGTKEIITDWNATPTAVVEAPKQEQQEKEEPQYKVVLYTTVVGDTLEKVADKHDVSVEDLREWNDMPSSFKSTQRLPKGQQLMLYVKPI